jgi:hypothetical protein
MAIPYMEEAAAANLAEAHGIVCHLTSLVMIDEAGEAQDGIPAQRKIPLMTPATQGATHGAIHAALRSRVAGGSFVLRRERAAPSAPAPAAVFASPPSMAPRQPRRAAEASPPRQSGTPALLLLLAQIDWSNAEDLRQGELSALPAAARALIAWASELDTVKRLATAIHATPETAAVGLLARLSADVDRNAARLFRAILGRAAADLLAAATQEMEAAAPMPVERRP